MDFKGYLGRGWAITKLDRDAAWEAANDEAAFGPAVLFFAIGGLAAGVGGSVFSGGASIVFAPVLVVICSFICVGILHLIAMLLGGTASYKSYYTALGLGSLPYWATVIPLLGHVLSLWYIPVAVVVTERVHGLSTARAIMVVLLPIVIALLLLILAIVLVGIAAIMAVLHAGGMQGM